MHIRNTCVIHAYPAYPESNPHIVFHSNFLFVVSISFSLFPTRRILLCVILSTLMLIEKCKDSALITMFITKQDGWVIFIETLEGYPICIEILKGRAILITVLEVWKMFVAVSKYYHAFFVIHFPNARW